MSETLEARLKRLKEEREEADRRYNDALTLMDRAIPGAPEIPEPLLPLDEHQLPTLNEAWNTLPAPPAFAGGVRQRLGAFVWRIVAPYLQRQLTFNSILVDHLNRTAEAQKAAHAHAAHTGRLLHAYGEATTRFHTHLMLYVQQVTAYVDTKDRDSAAGALVLNDAISAVADAQEKRAESFNAWRQRLDARIGALADTHQELRAIVGVTQQGLHALKRSAAADLHVLPAERPAVSGSPDVRVNAAFSDSLDAYKYVGFENQFRGPEAEIRAKQESYLPFFEGAAGDVLDVGCGRGEFIDLLISAGINARGIDLNTEMVEVCRERGLNVTHAEAVGYLSSLPDASLGGLFAAQVVEHLEPAYLLRFLELAGAKLRHGAPMVLETLNPACWTAFFESYIRDITHRWPLHPETLKYLVLASGFSTARIEFRSPLPAAVRLQACPLPESADPLLQEVVAVVNENAEKLNARLFTHMDYAIVAQTFKPPSAEP